MLPGDGIGPEVIKAALTALNVVAEHHGPDIAFDEFEWPSHAYYQRHGKMAPDGWLDTLKKFDAILLGALGDPGPSNDPHRFRLSDRISLSPLLQIRRDFDLWACERPAVYRAGTPRYLSDPRAKDVDMLVIRENSEGEYCGQGGRLHYGTPSEIATQVSVFTRHATERLIRHAFESAEKRALARQSSRKFSRSFTGKPSQVCLVTKRNALPFSGELYTDIFEQISKEFPAVAIHHELIDAACMKFVTAPWNFDVVVASNLHGDILTDLAAVLSGGMGIAPSANLNPENRHIPPMFEPTHGSAPDISGRGIAQPHAMLLTAAMMLSWMGAEDRRASRAAKDLEDAVSRDLTSHQNKSRRTTQEVTESVCRFLSESQQAATND